MFYYFMFFIIILCFRYVLIFGPAAYFRDATLPIQGI